MAFFTQQNLVIPYAYTTHTHSSPPQHHIDVVTIKVRKTYKEITGHDFTLNPGNVTRIVYSRETLYALRDSYKKHQLPSLPNIFPIIEKTRKAFHENKTSL